MALVGTISGSNGTSTTAITGSLIIANKPLGSFPSLPPGVNLYVSGARGADVDSASALFGGDVFMSGALGLQEYLQLRSINNQRFPTATTASYIYTSGSTNDLYFTQFSGSLRNDVRLRWLEGSLTTGLLNGGVISTENGTETFSVTAGAGIVIAQNAAITSEPYPTVEYVKWPAFVSASLVYSGSDQITYVTVDSAGALTQLNTPPTLAQYKDRIFLGRVLHQTGSVSNGAINSPAMAYAVSSNTFDFIRPFGPLKVSGHVLAASGSTLGLIKTAGDSYAEGRNYAFDPSSPNTILADSDPDLVDCKIYYEHVSGSTSIINTDVGNAGFNVIDPKKYNNGGDLDTVGNSEWTNQRVYWFPRSVNRALFVYYGSAKYGTLLEAVAGLLTENFVEGDNTKGAAIYVGSVSVKGNESSLTNTATVRITQGGLFRNSGGGGGGGGGSTPPGGVDTYVQFNDGSAFGGDAGLTYNKLTDSLTVTGNITGSNLLLTSGLIVTGSGIIESNTSTTAFRVTQQGSGNAIAVEDSTNPDATPFVVTAAGRVGIGTAIPAAYVFVSGTDPVIPSFVAKGPDVTVNTLSVTGSAGASTAVGFVNIDQGNYASKYGLTINNIGTGKSGLKLSANTTGGSFSIENMNTTPTIFMTQKNLWFESVSTAFDTSQVTYKFIENNKAVTYPNQKTFLISGNTNGPKTGSYFEVEKSGSLGPIKLLELQGDTTDNALFVSGAILASGSVFIAGDLAVSGGDITTTAATFNLITGSATTVNFAQSANAINIGKLTGGAVVTISSILTGSNPAFFGDTVTVGGPGQSNLVSNQTTANLFNTVATTINFGAGATTRINMGNSAGQAWISGSVKMPQGLSGSLTQLTDGTSYIIQGPGILVTSASNGAITLTGGGGTSPINVYTTTAGSPFELAIPAHSTMIEIESCGGGGGGGSGRKNPAANGVYGGGGGAGAAYSRVVLNAATVRAISSNLTITIGSGGTGGAAQTADSNNGNPGNPGNNTSVAALGTTLLVAPGGSAGQAGTNATGLGGLGPSWYVAGGNGANSSNTIAPNQAILAGFAGGGGAGGGVTTGAVALNGGNGGQGGDLRVDNVPRAGQGGNAVTPRNGTNATATATYSPTGGGGGGGGAGRNGGGGAAGAGGNGIQGGAGGGGGGNVDGASNDSGKGGDGGAGWCVVRFI